MYHNKIKKRDGKKCYLCNSTDNLYVHHIKTVGSGGTDEYNNLITLCHTCHMEKAHGKDKAHYRNVFEEYVSQFQRPIDWDQVMIASKKAKDKYKKYKNDVKKREYEKIKEQKWWETQYVIEQKNRQKAYKKEMMAKYSEEFKKTHNWYTPSQWEYRQRKKYLQDKWLLWK